MVQIAAIYFAPAGAQDPTANDELVKEDEQPEEDHQEAQIPGPLV